MYKLTKPITAGTRSLIALTRSELYKGKPIKSLVRKAHVSAGRNNTGRITVRHKGGGHKKAYRLIAFRRLVHLKSEVIRMEHDPNRNCCVALTKSRNNTCCYVLGIEGLRVGAWIEASDGALSCALGNAMMLKHIPVGSKVHNVEFYPNAGGALCRAAGTFCQVYSKSARAVTLKLCSGKLRLFNANCMATIGIIAGRNMASTKLGKAGRARWLGRRPSVRGVAMNPVDHPHGGGEGKTSGGRHPVTPWGKLTKGKKTRNNKRTDKLMVKPRRLH